MSTNESIPNHIGIIIDGNRRWAKDNNLPSFMGHQRGIERIDEIIQYALTLEIGIVTIYAFSTENWKRKKSEVSYLMELFETFAREKMEEFNELGIKMRVIGDTSKLPKSLKTTLEKAEELTSKNEKMIVHIGLNYGGRDEIIRVIRNLIDSKVDANDITEELINSKLDTAGLPDPDLIIRTSGEQRLSNFLLWQSAYSELYFPKVFWPDFNKEQFDLALIEFQRRRRRLGK